MQYVNIVELRKVEKLLKEEKKLNEGIGVDETAQTADGAEKGICPHGGQCGLQPHYLITLQLHADKLPVYRVLDLLSDLNQSFCVETIPRLLSPVSNQTF